MILNLGVKSRVKRKKVAVTQHGDAEVVYKYSEKLDKILKYNKIP